MARELLPRLDPADKTVAEARLAMATRAPEVQTMLRNVPAERQTDRRLLFERVRWLRRTNEQAAARQLLLSLDTSVPQDEDWWAERQYHARESLQASRAEEAYKLVVGHGLKRGAGFAEAEFMAGWIALRWLKPARRREIKHFKILDDGVSAPISKSRAAYWLGRAHEEAKRPLEAAGAYETRRAARPYLLRQLAASACPPRAADAERSPGDACGTRRHREARDRHRRALAGSSGPTTSAPGPSCCGSAASPRAPASWR